MKSDEGKEVIKILIIYAVVVLIIYVFAISSELKTHKISAAIYPDDYICVEFGGNAYRCDYILYPGHCGTCHKYVKISSIDKGDD